MTLTILLPPNWGTASMNMYVLPPLPFLQVPPQNPPFIHGTYGLSPLSSYSHFFPSSREQGLVHPAFVPHVHQWWLSSSAGWEIQDCQNEALLLHNSNNRICCHKISDGHQLGWFQLEIRPIHGGPGFPWLLVVIISVLQGAVCLEYQSQGFMSRQMLLHSCPACEFPKKFPKNHWLATVKTALCLDPAALLCSYGAV